MSQWGEERTFARDTALIRVIPDVEGEVFTPIADHHIVRSLVVLSRDGNEDVAAALLESIGKQFVGKPYSSWLAAGKVEETKDALLDHYSKMVREIKDILKMYDHNAGDTSAAQGAIAWIKRVIGYV